MCWRCPGGSSVRARVASFTLHLMILCLLKDSGGFCTSLAKIFFQICAAPFPRPRTINAPGGRARMRFSSLSHRGSSKMRCHRGQVMRGSAVQEGGAALVNIAGGMCQARRGEFLSPVWRGHCADKSLTPILASAAALGLCLSLILLPLSFSLVYPVWLNLSSFFLLGSLYNFFLSSNLLVSLLTHTYIHIEVM